MKKILIVTDFFLPHKSGITTYITNLINILKKQNFEVTILTCNYNGKLKELETIDNIRIVRSRSTFSFNRGFYSFDLIKKFKEESKKNDYINIHFPITEIFPLIFLTKKPVYLNYHCLPNDKSIFLKLIYLYFYFFGIISILKSRKVIVFTKDYFYSFFIHKFFKKNIIEIPPFVENSEENVFNEKKIHIDKIKIGFLGRLGEEKGLKDLIIASEIMLNKKIEHTIDIAGDLNDMRFKKNIKNLFRLRGNNTCINFIGKLKENNKRIFYNNIDFLVLPSTNSFEAFGLVQLEAMSYGKLVIASNIYGVRIPIKYTGNGLLFEKNNPAEIVKCIIKMREMLKKTKKKKIIESYNKYFNKKEFEKKFTSLFN